MTTKSRSGLNLLLQGSVTQDVIRLLPIPVMAIS